MNAKYPRIIELSETGSTNSDAMRLAVKGEALPLWVTAERQTAGRGRAGRTWTEGEGNLYASGAYRCAAPLERAGQLSLVAGIALIEAIRLTCPLAPDTDLRLKWPNDVLIGFSKAGGILVESTAARGGDGLISVIGFGVNLTQSPGELGEAATALAAHGEAPSRMVLLRALAEETDNWLQRWDNGAGFPTIRSAWMERAGRFGEAISINTVEGRRSGTYKGLSDSGSLLAEIDGQIETISYGDVAIGGAAANDGAA